MNTIAQLKTVKGNTQSKVAAELSRTGGLLRLAPAWVPGLNIGFEHSFVHQVADFLKGLEIGKPAGPTFRDALETQFVCDAVLKSAKTQKWEKVAK